MKTLLFDVYKKVLIFQKFLERLKNDRIIFKTDIIINPIFENYIKNHNKRIDYSRNVILNQLPRFKICLIYKTQKKVAGNLHFFNLATLIAK